MKANQEEQSLSQRKDADVTKKLVNLEFDQSHPPKPSAALSSEAQALKNLPDDTIDTSDIPPLTDEFWQTAIRNPFYKPTKTSATVRIDSDVRLIG